MWTRSDWLLPALARCSLCESLTTTESSQQPSAPHLPPVSVTSPWAEILTPALLHQLPWATLSTLSQKYSQEKSSTRQNIFIVFRASEYEVCMNLWSRRRDVSVSRSECDVSICGPPVAV